MTLQSLIVYWLLINTVELRFVYTLSQSSQLKNFHKAVDDAKRDLQTIKAAYGTNDEHLLRQRRRTIEELLANFQRNVHMADEMENTGNWYNNQYRDDICKGGTGDNNGGSGKDNCGGYNGKSGLKNLDHICKSSSSSSSSSSSASKCDDIKNSYKKTKKRGRDERNGLRTQQKSIQTQREVVGDNDMDLDDKEEQSADMNNLKSIQNYDDYYESDNLQQNDATDLENRRADGDDIEEEQQVYRNIRQNLNTTSNDQREQAKNDLTHEANYKLSKIEQDAAEQKKLGSKWLWKNTSPNKRSTRFNPMNEIKLKTSSRLMRKGFGPSLPSYSLVDTRRELMIDDMVKKLEKNMNRPAKNAEFERLDSDAGNDDNNYANTLPRLKRLNELREQQQQIDVLSKTEKRQQRSAEKRHSKAVATHKTVLKLQKERKNQKAKKEKQRVKLDKYNKDLKSDAIKRSDEQRQVASNVVDKLKRAQENQAKRRVKRIGELGLNGLVVVKQYADALPAEGAEAEQFGKQRNKRSLEEEHEIYKERNDFDTFEKNEDDAHVRVKRNIAATNLQEQNTTMQSINVNTTKVAILLTNEIDHKIFKRSSNDNEDFDNDKHYLLSVAGANDVNTETNFNNNFDREKRKDIDFGIAVHDFGNEKFDNLKMKTADMDKYDGVKFDNMWYENNDGKQMNKTAIKQGTKRADKVKTSRARKLEHNHNGRNRKQKIKTNKKSLAKNGSDTDMIGQNNEMSEIRRNLAQALRDDILNCTSLETVEKFLKKIKQGKQQQQQRLENTEETTNTIATEKIDIYMEENTSEPSVINHSNNTEQSIVEANKNDMMKLNITINASVMGDQKANNFYGNGTIKVQPGFGEDRQRRQAFFEELNSFGKRNAENQRNSNSKQSEAEKVSVVVPGKLSSQVVKSIFGLVQKDPKLQVLWESLKHNQLPPKENKENFYPLATSENQPKLHQTEEMLAKTMENLNEMIEQQVRERTCIPLSPDLSSFYELILQTHALEAKNRIKRAASFGLNTDFSAEVHALDANKIDEKSRIVKKLLKQYEELPQEEQQQVTAIRDDLLMDLLYLRKLKDNHDSAERDKRDSTLQTQVSTNAADGGLLKKLEFDYTPQFLKLLKTSELFNEASNDQDSN